jgi:hypothetical protein
MVRNAESLVFSGRSMRWRRRVIGLRIIDPVGVLQRATYPHGHAVFEGALDTFLGQFLHDAVLEPVDPKDDRGVETTCAPADNTGWIPWNR